MRFGLADTALKAGGFESIEEQNQWLMHWEEQWAAKRIHGRMETAGSGDV